MKHQTKTTLPKSAFWIWVSLILFGVICVMLNLGQDDYDKEDQLRIEAPKEGHTFDDLLDAIEWVESKGDP